MSNSIIRNYRAEDLPGVIKLYESTKVNTPFFLRGKDYFNYFVSYPGVKEDSIFVAASENGIEGVAIIAIIQKQYTLGRVIELWASEKRVGDALLQKGEEYCRVNNVDAVEVNPPTFLDSGSILRNWLRVDQGKVMMAKPLSLVSLLQPLLNTTALDKIGVERGFLFACDDEIVEVKLNETGVSVTERDKSWQDLNSTMIKASSRSLLGIIFGSTNPYIALLTGQVKIRSKGIRDIFRGIRMLQAIRINQPWVVAMVDSR